MEMRDEMENEMEAETEIDLEPDYRSGYLYLLCWILDQIDLLEQYEEPIDPAAARKELKKIVEEAENRVIS